MCGIVGYLGKDNYYDYIINGLKLLQNRGYDSAGISYIYQNKIETIKYASTSTNNSLDILETNINTNEQSHIAIGHTRWATHGPKTNENAHPHLSNNKDFSIVHNGIIENFQQLKNDLLEEGYTFHSQTDTEVICILLEKFYKNTSCIQTSIENTIQMLQGTWALVIIHTNYPDQIWLTRNGSPLYLDLMKTLF